MFSQDLINQGREKVVEATNSVTAARIQPLEDIISTIVSTVDNCRSKRGDGKMLDVITLMTVVCDDSAILLCY